MRLWHEKLMELLPNKQLQSQHRECCALRGKGWGRKHATVDYVFTHSRGRLVAYHIKVLQEMERRGMEPDKIWYNPDYRGKILGYQSSNPLVMDTLHRMRDQVIYEEHNNAYLASCVDNLINKLRTKLELYNERYGPLSTITLKVSQELDKFIILRVRDLSHIPLSKF